MCYITIKNTPNIQKYFSKNFKKMSFMFTFNKKIKNTIKIIDAGKHIVNKNKIEKYYDKNDFNPDIIEVYNMIDKKYNHCQLKFLTDTGETGYISFTTHPAWKEKAIFLYEYFNKLSQRKPQYLSLNCSNFFENIELDKTFIKKEYNPRIENFAKPLMENNDLRFGVEQWISLYLEQLKTQFNNQEHICSVFCNEQNCWKVLHVFQNPTTEIAVEYMKISANLITLPTTGIIIF